MDGRLVIQLIFTAALSGVNGVSSDIGYNNSESLKKCGYNTHFNDSVNRCVECRLGSYGVNCKEECIRGYYGYLCRTSCSCEVSACDPVTGCQDHSNVSGNTNSKKPTQGKTTIPYQESSAIHSESTKLILTQERGNPVFREHHENQIWMLVCLALVGFLGTTFIAGLLIYTRKLGWCKSTSQYPYLGGGTAIAGNNIEVEPDGQPIGEMCGSNDDVDVYDEIRNSFQYNCSNSWVNSRLSPCCGNGSNIRDRETQMSQNIYSKYEDEDDGQYSTLQLKKRQSADSNMNGWPRREGACSSQEEYASLKSSGIIGDAAKKRKGRLKILNRISGVNFTWRRQNKKSIGSLTDFTSENGLVELNKGAANEEYSMTTGCSGKTINEEERPYSLVNICDINDEC